MEIKRDQKVAAATTATTAKEAANAQAEIDQLRANRAAVVFGLTAALGMALCGYLEADFLTTAGVDFGTQFETREQILMMAITGLVTGGGAKGLHDAISNISKSSTKKSTPPETGGQT
ncbi:hypothetical protein D0Z08_25900 [Nocardioides immobilis]|uniref:Uncharacterized protein n=1 Tax=Nocardioides immobilis TaxID=2049295 RepID=A0A417XUY7_9ACTN|nr:hypothetical protein D0Z08_25900 [Nocardioides immobilis]